MTAATKSSSQDSANGNASSSSFTETLERKWNTSAISPRTDDSESSFLVPSLQESNISSKPFRSNSIVSGASPFASTSSLWASMTNLDSLSAGTTAPTTPISNDKFSTSDPLWESARRASGSVLLNGSSWKCVGSSARVDQNRLNDFNESSKINSRPRSSSVVIERPSLASISVNSSNASLNEEDFELLSGKTSRSSTPQEQRFMQIPALLHEEIGIENAEEAAEIFKRSSMDNLLDIDPTDIFSSLNLTTLPSSPDLTESTLMSSVHTTTTDFRRHSVNWLSSNEIGIDGYSNKSSSTFNQSQLVWPSIKSIAEFVPSHSTTPSRLSPASSHSLDSFPEEFFFAPSSVTHFSKKRFARRHSIATDGGISTLEDSFAQSLNFGNPASSIEFNPNSHYSNGNSGNSYLSFGCVEEIPVFNGNVYAAYSGLLKDDFIPDQPLIQEMNTFLNSMKTGTSGAAALLHHQMPISISPIQAGINPTALSFPSATFHLSSHKGPLYLVEFKAGRTEIFFVVDLDTALKVKVDDLVIVEADRGEDLGRITCEIPMAKIRQLIYQTPSEIGYHSNLHQHNSSGFNDDSYGSTGNVNHNLAGLKESEIAALISSKEIVPKRIHRLVTTLDVRFLQAKAQEEALAMVRCQTRIRQKKLPMEVVDAEYQWDRNKLTFYFSAERRIDFRELVRDLFRIYKTRIWMCAVDKNRANLLNSLIAQ